MKSRILQVRKYLGLSQKAFGEALGVTRDVIANYENGRVVPTQTIIKLLGTKYSISQKWLETGNGEMLDQTKQKSDLEILFETLSTNDKDGYKKRLVSVMARLKPEDWEVLERIAREMRQPEPPSQADPTAAEMTLEQEADEFAAMAREQFISEKKQASQALSAKESDVG